MNIFELFTEALHRETHRVAIVCDASRDRREATYSDLDRQIDTVMTQLLRADLQAGGIVLLAVPVSLETYVVMLALLKAGMVVMTIDPAHSAARVAEILREPPPVGIISTRAISLMRFVFPELRKIPVRFVVNGPKGNGSRQCFSDDNVRPSAVVKRSSADSAVLSFTSGSSGKPKGVLRTHGFLREQINMLNRISDSGRDEIDFVVLPMFVLFNLANGVTNVIPACDMKRPGRADPRIVYEQLARERVTRVIASPSLLERLARHCVDQHLQLPSIRRISTGGGPVSPTLAGRIAAIAPNSFFQMVYGSTEAEPIATINGDEVSACDRRRMREGAGLLVGHAVQGCDVQIIRHAPPQEIGACSHGEFESLFVTPGVVDSIGEIVVSGKHVLQGYVNTQHNLSTKIDVDSNIWHRTGDAGYFDAGSRLWLVGRCSAAIRDCNGAVYPFQVEYAVNNVAGVHRSALVCHAGARVLVVEAIGREFRSDCVAAARCIAKFHIDRILTVRKIPMDKRHNSKVDYVALSQLLNAPGERYRMATIEWLSILFRSVRSAFQRVMHSFHQS
jgi:olefin beta-lactone synthetase